MMQLDINSDLDTGALAAQFTARGFVQVPDVFAAPQAQRLHDCLRREVPWGLAYYDEGARLLRAHELKALSPQQRQALEQRIYGRARSSYQYAYNSYPMLDAYLQGWNEVPLLNGFLEALNDAPMLELVRAISGFSSIIKADAQATRFGPGQFLRQHVDRSRPGEEWLVAYVYNLTPRWQPDWGGYLQLLDAGGDIRAGLLPRFNALNLLAVPQPHLVSMVTPFAGAARYAITGWFRSR